MGGRAMTAARAAAVAAVLVSGPGWAGVQDGTADAVSGHLDAGARAYRRGDITVAARELQAAVMDLQQRLGRDLAAAMPPVPAGWQADDPEVEGLGSVGGGLSVTRAYTRDDSSLNVSIILDSPAVGAAAALMANPTAQPNLKRVKVGAEDALLRWDAAARSGEITLVVASRVLLQIEGDGLPGDDALVDLARGFDVAALRKLLAA